MVEGGDIQIQYAPKSYWRRIVRERWIRGLDGECERLEGVLYFEEEEKKGVGVRSIETKSGDDAIVASHLGLIRVREGLSEI